MQDTVFTVGHSTHPQSRLIELLQEHGITALCDVRSKPYSRMNPQFNRPELEVSLRECGIVYVFLGRELGARSEDPSCYRDGKVQYERLANTELFKDGLRRVREGMKKYRVALMCAEKEPLECHRTILVARRLAALGLNVEHIHADGHIETHEDAVERLKAIHNLAHEDLFRSRDELLDEAYRRQEGNLAYELENAETSTSALG